MAAQKGHDTIVSALLDAGADIETSMHGNGWTPLFVAAWAGKDDVVGVLLRAAANPTAETTSGHLGIPAGSTPISVAQVQGHVEVVRLLEA